MELTTNNVWMMLCTALVFIMHLGFATLEVGLTRQKNTVNILFKNMFIVCAGLILYYCVGFGLMYPGDSWIANKILGFSGAGLTLPGNGLTADYASSGYTYWTDFLFQGMFAATCATIISGAVAERIKLDSFLIGICVFVAFVYPIAGSWVWGGGFVADTFGFHDFAGSTIVHSVGGWGALVATWLLGPRIGKYGKDGSIHPIPGSNIPLATIGALILWFGWFGFNGGSVLNANPSATSFVLVTTCLAAAAGGLGAVLSHFVLRKTLDLTMLLNGVLAGLVGITAGADVVPSPSFAILIGFLSGILVVGSVIFFDKMHLDDPVGALSVHLVCGIFGTLMVGLCPGSTVLGQFFGVVIYGVFAITCSFIIFYPIKKLFGLRVSEMEEIEGLDLHEHQMHGYNNG